MSALGGIPEATSPRLGYRRPTGAVCLPATPQEFVDRGPVLEHFGSAPLVCSAISDANDPTATSLPDRHAPSPTINLPEITVDQGDLYRRGACRMAVGRDRAAGESGYNPNQLNL